MQQRFDDFFPDGSAGSSSLGQSLLQEDEHEITEEKVEKALHDHLAGKPQKFVQNHLSLLQRNLKEAEQHQEALLGCLFSIFKKPYFWKLMETPQECHTTSKNMFELPKVPQIRIL